jgi:hypothetical protein
MVYLRSNHSYHRNYQFHEQTISRTQRPLLVRQREEIQKMPSPRRLGKGKQPRAEEAFANRQNGKISG